METAQTTFTAQNNGFRFVNLFELPDFFDFKLPFKSPAAFSLKDYGLCGGMCFGALDFFFTGQPIPPYTQPDEINTKLFFYLWNRQLDSLGSNVLLKVFQWMLREDASIAGLVRRFEIPKIRTSIDQGKPAVLSLIRVKGLSSPTDNHQVLVTRYEFDPLTKKMKLTLYDPNHPLQTPDLTMDLTEGNRSLDVAQSTGEELHGFFVIPYKQESPP